MKRNGLWLAAVAGFLLSLAGAQPARADYRHDRRECERKIDKEERKLEKEVRKHGWRSRQAERQREKIFRLRRECGFGSGWDRNDRNDRRHGRHEPSDNRSRWGRWDHDPDHCRVFDHHHDHDGGFRWGGSFWIRIR